MYLMLRCAKAYIHMSDCSRANANESLHIKMRAGCVNTGFVGSLRIVASVNAVTAELKQGVG